MGLGHGMIHHSTPPGCGDGVDVLSCVGYELVNDISLMDYSKGEGWPPLGHDADSSTDGCEGTGFVGTFEGNGKMISDLSINLPNENCVGLFGHIAKNSEIRNLRLRATTVMGNNRVGALVGRGGGKRKDDKPARIHSSLVVADKVIGVDRVGGLVGSFWNSRIYSSSVVVAYEVKGDDAVGGLVGWGESTRVYSSSVVAAAVKGNGNEVGGLVGQGKKTEIYSSSIVADKLDGSSQVGGLAGIFDDFSRVAYSYVVSGSNTVMLVGSGGGKGTASYWDSSTSRRNSGNHGRPKPSQELRNPTPYEGIYAAWSDDTDIFRDGMRNVPLAVWCDKDRSGSIKDRKEKTNSNFIWDFGGRKEYPAIKCTPITPTKWRGLWDVNDSGNLVLYLDRSDLDKLFP